MKKLLLILFILSNSRLVRSKADVASMVIYKVEKVYLNESFGDFNLTVSRISRKDFAITVYFYTYQIIDDSFFITLHVDALYSNQFRRTPLEVTRNACSFLKSEYAWVKDEISKYGKMPYDCPVPLALYYVKDYVLDASKIPDLPWKEIRANFDVSFRSKDSDKKTLVSSLALYIRNNQDYVKLTKDV